MVYEQLWALWALAGTGSGGLLEAGRGAVDAGSSSLPSPSQTLSPAPTPSLPGTQTCLTLESGVPGCQPHAHCLPGSCLHILARVWLTSPKPWESKLLAAAAVLGGGGSPHPLGITSLLMYSFISFRHICFGSVLALPQFPI